VLKVHLDRFAIALSSICAIHCIALPLVAGLVPLLAVATNHENALHEFWFHQFILIFILPVSIFALIVGYRLHHQLTPVLIGATGLVILTTIALFADILISQQIIPRSVETLSTVLGGIIHAIGHIANVLATKSYRTCCSIE